jgi:hypothetical protein
VQREGFEESSRRAVLNREKKPYIGTFRAFKKIFSNGRCREHKLLLVTFFIDKSKKFDLKYL